MSAVHLVVGPDEHGVVRHGLHVARACGDGIVRDPADLPVALATADVVHVPFTDRLFGATAEAALAAIAGLADTVAAAGASLSVTLHDVPHDDSPLQRRRRRAYEQIIGLARGVVVNSRVELGLVQDAADAVHSLRVIPLPVEPAQTAESAATAAAVGDNVDADVAVLGFVFPDRGYDEVLAALPPGAVLTAIGRAADGHEDLVARYAGTGRWRCTGYVPDDELAARLAAAAVPVAPNRRVTASASINTWLGHGRRPLVPDSPYARELVSQRPGALALYDPDDPASLAAGIAAALADPSRTRLPAGVPPGPSPAEVAGCYRTHLDACAPPRAAAAGVVPGNRWDLADLARPAAGRVSVVIPYFDAQQQLDRVLAALSAQSAPPAEIVIVDDGSPRPPGTGACDLPVTVLRQDDLGFRAARARNLGARAAVGDVVVFLDGDTVPEPGFVAALTRLPLRCPDAVTVGRRRHRDPATGAELPEPAWLREAYAASGDLLHADRRSYRFMISALLAVPAALFDATGGFDERFVGYGGEDWEFAHRLWCAGAVFAHVRAAVAWHDGPDWAARADADTRAATKNAETAALAGLLPDPDARGAGRWLPYPSVVVCGGVMSDVDALGVVRSAGDADCAFWFDEITGPHRDVLLAQPHVSLGSPPADVLARAWCRARLHAPTHLGGLMALAERTERHGRIDTPALSLRASRAVHRAARRGADADILFGRHDRTGPVATPVADLARWLR